MRINLAGVETVGEELGAEPRELPLGLGGLAEGGVPGGGHLGGNLGEGSHIV